MAFTSKYTLGFEVLNGAGYDVGVAFGDRPNLSKPPTFVNPPGSVYWSRKLMLEMLALFDNPSSPDTATARVRPR